MKHFSSILLLFVFFLFQGGRVLLYLECRISSAANCDCVKVLADSKPGPEAAPSHKHLTEELELLTTTFYNNVALLISVKHVGCTEFIPAGVSTDVFHPPGA